TDRRHTRPGRRSERTRCNGIATSWWSSFARLGDGHSEPPSFIARATRRSQARCGFVGTCGCTNTTPVDGVTHSRGRGNTVRRSRVASEPRRSPRRRRALVAPSPLPGRLVLAEPLAHDVG